jgi:hypothetical protein
MHTSTDSAAQHLALIAKDPMKWWKDPKTITAREKFNDLCLTIDKDPLDSWIDFFSSLPDRRLKNR